MKKAKFDTEIASLCISVKSRELADKHQKDIRRLESDLSNRNMLNQGLGLRKLQELYEIQLKEDFEATLICVLEAIEKDKFIDEKTETEMYSYLDKYGNNQLSALQSTFQQIVMRTGLPNSFNKIFKNGLSYICNKLNAEFKNKLKLEIKKQNSTINANQNQDFEKHSDYYVDPKRILELEEIKSEKFDLIKLIQFCENLNKSYKAGSLFPIPLIVRAIIDHIPPIFNKANFKEVSNNYKGEKSFKESMSNLNNSLRKVADAHLHVQIRKKEVLPNFTQVDFKTDLDVLLSEIVRILK